MAPSNPLRFFSGVTKVKPSNASQQYRRAPKKLVKYHGLFGKEHHDAESEDVYV